jgi:hypothetical protein
VKHRAGIVMGVLLTPMHPLKYVPSRTVYDALVTWTVKQIVQLFIKRYTEDVTAMQQSIRVADSSM